MENASIETAETFFQVMLARRLLHASYYEAGNNCRRSSRQTETPQ